MKIILYISLLFILPLRTQATERYAQIRSFEKIIVSPHINLVLIQGNDEQVKIETSGINEDKVMVETDNGVLSIYLEGARYHNKYEKEESYSSSSHVSWKNDIYRDAEVTAYVTFRVLESIQVRGEQKVSAEGTLDLQDLKVALYGEVDLQLNELTAREMKWVLYGENQVQVNGGSTGEQVIKCYGQNTLDLQEFPARQIRTKLYGENRLKLHASGEIKVSAMGESDIDFKGDAFISRGLIVGDTFINRIR